MRYSGQAVEIFGWTPSGQRVPRLRSHVIGENIGDHAFVDDRAMYWDGDVWRPLLWKDFAVWTKADDTRRAPDIGVVEIALDDASAVHDEIDLDNLPVGDGDVEYELPAPAE